MLAATVGDINQMVELAAFYSLLSALRAAAAFISPLCFEDWTCFDLCFQMIC